MHKLRVGLIIYADSLPTEGGSYSYYDMLLKGINEFKFDPNIEMVNIIFYNSVKPGWKTDKETIFIKVGYGMQVKGAIKEKSIRFGLSGLNRRHPMVNFVIKLILNKRNTKLRKILEENNIDIIYYLKPEFDVLDYPFIATHWDVAHRSVTSFPEVAMNGEYEVRENYYLYTLNKAFLILCESETGVNELIKFYSISRDKIKVLPIFAGDVINEKISSAYEEQTLKNYGLQKGKFFIYPAQFWALKNHFNLVVAFHKLVSETGQNELRLVLCGSDKINAEYIRDVVRSLSLDKHVIFPGFISNKELNVLYKNATALTMLTFLGPTNLPLLEAAHLNCPVICSNLAGHREMLGDNAIYVDPVNTRAIKDAMQKILNPAEASMLKASAYKHIRQSPFNLYKSLRVLNNILLGVLPFRKTWGVKF